MKLKDRYHHLTFWNKVGFWGSVASVVGLLIALVSLVFSGRVDRSVKAGGDIKIENGMIQTGDGTITIPKLESKP